MFFYYPVSDVAPVYLSANWWAVGGLRPLVARGVWYWLSTLSSRYMRESTHALRCDFLCLQVSGSGRGKPARLCIDISRTQLFQENRRFDFQVRVVLKPLVSLIGRLVACSVRISVDTRTETPTNRNPRCACAPMVNKGHTLESHTFIIFIMWTTTLISGPNLSILKPVVHMCTFAVLFIREAGR